MLQDLIESTLGSDYFKPGFSAKKTNNGGCISPESHGTRRYRRRWSGRQRSRDCTASAGHEGPITMLGSESNPPYRRPPLSKDYLAGKNSHEHLYLKPAQAYAKLGIDFKPGREVVGLDRTNKRVSLADGDLLSYDKLILAIGGKPRQLELAGSRQPNVYYICTIDDIDQLRAEFLPGTKMVIIGAGYIGLETAAVAIQTRIGCNRTQSSRACVGSGCGSRVISIRRTHSYLQGRQAAYKYSGARA
ncbi:FAD/NAD(P)-binding oxidoreductase [Pseudomonas marginalis]|nr:FAD/NAD(P)-binding oxidoreductase [Pseudomonas marginalis]WGT27986.1 FAD/NAD(P)-binding oxidoreductase [Pseudomonas marginalis]